MDRTEVEEYEVWDLSPLPIPARSTLYALQPIGVGTPWVECLTSYIARLADAHCVYPGTLLDKVIVPLVPSPSPAERRRKSSWTSRNGFDLRNHPSFRPDGKGSYLINGTGLTALYAAHVLEMLTTRTDFHHLTLLKLTEVLPSRGLLRPTKAWCPVCYEELRISGQVIYDPLLWIFQEVTICVRHQQRLLTRCLNSACARLLPSLTWRSQPGRCPFCHSWLGRSYDALSTQQPLEETELIWQQWVTQSLGAVLSTFPVVTVPPTRERLSQVVTHVVQQVTDGNASAFARALNTSRNKIDHWRHGERIPEMDILLRLCYRLSLSLSDLLICPIEALQPDLRESIHPALFTPRKRVAINKEQLSQSLEQAMTSDEFPPPSLKEVGQRLGGHQQTTLYKIHRTACHAIAERYTHYRRELREKRLQGYRDEIRRIGRSLQAQGISLTQKHIAPYLVQPAMLRDPKVRELLREVCHELETRDGEKLL